MISGGVTEPDAALLQPGGYNVCLALATAGRAASYRVLSRRGRCGRWSVVTAARPLRRPQDFTPDEGRATATPVVVVGPVRHRPGRRASARGVRTGP